MAATKSQGRALTIFLVGITTACAGLSYYSSGSGKLTFFVGLVVLLASFALCIKIKSEEGKIASKGQPALLKLVGVGVVLLGWVTVLYGLHLTTSVSGRMTTSIIGFAISLVGVIHFLPAAQNKNAIWK
jgi:heme A synthase